MMIKMINKFLVVTETHKAMHNFVNLISSFGFAFLTNEALSKSPFQLESNNVETTTPSIEIKTRRRLLLKQTTHRI